MPSNAEVKELIRSLRCHADPCVRKKCKYFKNVGKCNIGQMMSDAADVLESVDFDYLYNSSFYPMSKQGEDIVGSIENALGLKLLSWQKDFILGGNREVGFRKTGKTMCQAIKQLLTEDEIVIKRGFGKGSDWYIDTLCDIAIRFDNAGIKHGKVVIKR